MKVAEFDRWFKDNAEHLRYAYPLKSDSIVLDVGSYNGEFSKAISDFYNCKIYSFEPIKAFFKKSVENLSNYPNVEIFNFGIGKNNRAEWINIDADSSSIYKLGYNWHSEQIMIRSIQDIVEELNLVNIDLIKINVEGCEYEILDSIIESDYIRLFKNIQVQFHEFFPDCYKRRKKIIDKILETHEVTYQYAFVWENFRLVK